MRFSALVLENKTYYTYYSKQFTLAKGSHYPDLGSVSRLAKPGRAGLPPQKVRFKERFQICFKSKTAAEQQRLKERQRALDNSTQRTLFDFEYAQTIDLTRNEIIQMSFSQFSSSDYTIK